MIAHQAVKLAARARLLTATGLPGASHRAFEGVDFTPTTGHSWVRESYLPGGAAVRTMPTAGGHMEATPIYQVDVFTPVSTGFSGATLVDTLLAHFRPGTGLTHASLPAGHTVRVRADVAPTASRLVPDDEYPGWVVQSVSIPLMVYALNA